MPRLALLLCAFCLSHLSHAQYFVWSDPEPVTDSVYNHTRPCLNLNDPLMFYEGCHLVWEQWDDTLSKAIYARDLNTMEDPFPLLSQPGIHYRNPQKVSWEDDQMWFFLLYETDINGNWDIYQVKYLKDGTVTVPEPVCATMADERNFSWKNELLAWQRNDAILIAWYSPYWGFLTGTQPVVLDSGNCRQPVCSYNTCAWEKAVGASTEVWYSQQEYTGGQYTWSVPDTIIASGVNTGLFIENMMNDALVFQHQTGDHWQLKGYNLYYNMEYEMPGFSGSDNVTPWLLDIILPVETYPLNTSFLTWASDTTGNMEIFVNEEVWNPIYINISENNVSDRNPRLFAYYGYTARAYLFWESFRNDHWQLWMIYQDIPIGMDDPGSADTGDDMLIYPNPASGAVHVACRESIDCIEVVSGMGQIFLREQGTGNTFRFDTRELPAGIYLVRVYKSSGINSRKLVID